MDKLSLRFIPVSLLIIAIGILGYITDYFLPKHLSWVPWAMVVVMYILFTFLRETVISKLRSHAYKDSLTGLENRRYFNYRLNNELSRTEKSESYISFLMVDIDNFKRINDTYGHREGDRVLKQISSIFKQSIRTNDILARWGGEEFSIILPCTDNEGALKLAERIRRAVEEHEFICNSINYGITVSIGVASVKGGVNGEKLVELADQALYRAKEKKNLVCAA